MLWKIRTAGRGVLCVSMAFLWMPLSFSAGIERLAPTQSFGVANSPAPQPVELEPVPGFFDDIMGLDRTHNNDDSALRTSLLKASRSLRSFSINQRHMGATQIITTDQAWLDLDGRHDWELGASSWRYKGWQNAQLVIGTTEAQTPEWAKAPRVGGVQIQQEFNSDEQRYPWRYNVSIGALSLSNNRNDSDLHFGATASSLWVDVDVAKNLSIDTLIEAAPAFQVAGIGGRYKLGRWGAWSSSVARASHEFGNGWRYQASYDTTLTENLTVRVNSERYQGAFADLSRFEQRMSSGTGGKHSVDARLGLGRWGTLKGEYITHFKQFGTHNHELGLGQQFWYSPNLRIALHAQREFNSGDYIMALRFAVPLR